MTASLTVKMTSGKVVEDKESITGDVVGDSGAEEQTGKLGETKGKMFWIIIGIVVVLALIGIGYWYKKKH